MCVPFISMILYQPMVLYTTVNINLRVENMKALKIIFFATLAMACNETKPEPAKDLQVNTVDKAPAKPGICDTDFDVFFKKFESDSVFQKEHIKFPLKNSYLDDNYENFIREDITEAKYRFLDFASDKDAMKQEYDKYTVEVTKHEDTVDYLLRGYDNGIMINITFSFINGCWYLIEIEDAST